MSVTFRTIEEALQPIFYLQDRVLEQKAEYKSQAENWVINLKKRYRPEEYLAKLEEQGVYLAEASDNVIELIAEYFTTGKPLLLEPQEMQVFVKNISVKQPLENTPHHVNYIRNGCSGCPVHEKHFYYDQWKSMRSSGISAEYQDTLEFACKYYQCMFMLGTTYLHAFLSDRTLAGSARDIVFADLLERVRNQIELVVNLCLDNVGFAPESLNTSQESKKRWKFWK
jgi:hypothetical protein